METGPDRRTPLAIPMSHTPRRQIRIRPRVRDEDRKRAAKACWRCRNRKSRCIVVRNAAGDAVCKRCVKDDRECIFGPDSSEIRARLADVQLSEHTIHHAQNPDPPTISTSPTSIRSLALTPHQEASRDDQSTSPTAVKRPAGQLVVRNPHQTHYVGGVSNGTFISKVQDAVVSESPSELRREESSDFFHSAESDNDIDAELLHRALTGFPPKAVADFLVSTFFHTVEANYYYMDREDFKKRLNACYDTSTPDEDETVLDATFVCLALMVFAMGSQFAELRRPIQAKPAMPLSKHGPGMVFYLKAKILLSDVITQCSLESIQICFLIGLFLLPTNTSDLSYIYHGMALKMAISAGLHRQVGTTNLSPRVLHVRNRLWWSLYTSERRLTIILDRPESIREEDTDTPLPEFSEELDFPESTDNIANLQASIQLTRIYNRAVAIGRSVDFAAPEAEESVAEIRRQLDSWRKCLPPRLQLGNLSPEDKSFRGSVHLHMSYNQVTIYMGRAVLLRGIQRRLRPRQEQSNDTDGQYCISSEHAQTLSRECVEAAYNIVDLIRFLLGNKKLARFSFTDVNCCNTAGIIIAVNELIRLHPLFQPSMGVVMSAMKHMATGCQNAKHGLRLIQNLQVIVTASLKSRASDKSTMDAQGRTPSTSAGYEEWEDWMTQTEKLAPQVAPQPRTLSAVQSAISPGQWQGYLAGDGADVGQSSIQGETFAMPRMGNADIINSTTLYDWPNDWNSLGLSGFEGLEFSGA